MTKEEFIKEYNPESPNFRNDLDSLVSQQQELKSAIDDIYQLGIDYETKDGVSAGDTLYKIQSIAMKFKIDKS